MDEGYYLSPKNCVGINTLVGGLTPKKYTPSGTHRTTKKLNIASLGKTSEGNSTFPNKQETIYDKLATFTQYMTVSPQKPKSPPPISSPIKLPKLSLLEEHYFKHYMYFFEVIFL